MATIATIAAINGTGSVYAVNAQGVQRLLKAGDALEKGETIRTVGDVNVELLSEDMRALHINPDQVVKLDDNVFQTEQTPTTADAAVTTPATTNTVIQALENGQDLSTQLDATAAGLGDGGGGGGASFVQLTRISEGVNGNTYGFDFNGLGTPGIDPGVGTTSSTSTTAPTTTTTSTTLTLTADPASVAEGGHVTYTVKLGAPVTSDMTITLSNGATILVTAGSSTGVSQPVDVRSNDVYVEGNVDVKVTVATAQGGGFDHLVVNDGNVVTVVGDSIDTTTVTLSVSGQSSGEGSEAVVVANGSTVTVTAHVDHTPQTDLVITLNTSTNGVPDTITIKAGQLSGSTNVVAHADISETQTAPVNVNVTAATGGNYENLDTSGAAASVTVTDIKNITTVTITSSGDVTENDAGVTFTVQLSNPPQTGTTATATVTVDGVAHAVTLDANGKGTLVIDTHNPDVYKDGHTVTATVTGVTGGNFEAISLNGATASAQVTDVNDTTTVTITSSGNVTENDAGVTFTVQLSNPPQTGTTATATVMVGEVAHVVTLDANGKGTLFVETQNPDVYKDGHTVTATVTGVNGGNFEAVSVEGATASAQVTDVNDTTTVTITSSGNVTENDAGVTFTVQLSNPPQTGTTATATVMVGEVAHVVTLDANGKGTLFVETQNPDVYKDGHTVTATVTAINGGNFEATSVEGATASAQVTDVNDTTTVTITSSGDVTENDAGVTFTVQLSNPPQTGTTATATVMVGEVAHVVTLDANGKGTLFVETQNPDVYKDGHTVTATVTAINGGNFEATSVEGATASAYVADTVDAYKVVLSSVSSVVEGSGVVTYTATLVHVKSDGTTEAVTSNPYGQAITVTLSDNSTITIPANGLTATHDMVVQGNDVYHDPSTISLSITGLALAGTAQAESLTPDTTPVTVSVTDSIDPTTVTLGAISVDPTTGLTTISATVDHAPQAGSPLTVTLSNGAIITFDADHTSATSTAFVAPTATTTYSIDSSQTSGGNFEQLNLTSTATLTVTDTLIIGGTGDDTNLNGGIGKDIVVGDPGSTALKAGQSANIVFVLDTSGSMISPISFTNSTGTHTETRLQALEDSVIATLKQLASSGAHVVVHLDQFSDTASSIGTFDLSEPGKLDLAISAVKGLTPGGNTNYEAGLQSALNWINTATVADVNKVVFVSDGQPNALNNNTGNGTETTNESSSTSDQAIAAVLGTLSASGSIHADHVSEVAAIAAKGYDLQAVGINVGSGLGTSASPTALGFLSELEGYNYGTVTTGHTADNITTANQLASTIGSLTGSQTIATAAGSDVLHGGAGNDLIFGDAMNTDKLAADHGLTGLYPAGSGSAVFTALESGNSGWTRTDTVNYIQTHADELGAESGRSGGNDVIYGEAGNDRIYGQEGNDTIDGGAGDDWIRGGTGNDTLTGGVGADVFAWSLGDQGTSSAKAVDHITDFQANMAGEAIDLRDLLQGEHSAAAMGGTAASGSLTQFVKFDLTTDGKLEMLVTHDPVHNSGVTQAIVLDNFTGANVDVAKASLAHTLDASFSASSISDADLLKKLIDTGHLKTDA
ncbi:retention module-containing protein [Rhodoferax sp. GW822-FHT02A01]|uniref:retention module-containing protein n=1 Tax=Rhodoferax sp. GW822-FHT02A01 TaxID=3141537 RepID=UPI00315D9A7E